jgi:hypothetical protein
VEVTSSVHNASSSDGVQQPPTLTFVDKHHARIRSGDKTATIRVDPSHPYNEDDRITLTGTDDEPIAEAVVTDRWWTTARMAAGMGVAGHRDYEGVEDLLEELREYYPDAEIDATTQVDVIQWELVEDE